MIENSIFDWYKFYEVGCSLLEKGEEENLRTAINRFYYASFCFSRDFLIENNIYHNADLKKNCFLEVLMLIKQLDISSNILKI